MPAPPGVDFTSHTARILDKVGCEGILGSQPLIFVRINQEVAMRTMTLRFYVVSVTENAGGSHQVLLQPSYKDGANSDWSKYTPSGRLELNLSQDAAVDFYVEALRNKSDIHIELSAVAPAE